jgi:hypothetical protein
MRTLEQYLALITSEHQDRLKFKSVVAIAIEPAADLQSFLLGMPAQFDLDLAIGAQLDVVGQWVGFSRLVSIPYPSPWMALDDPTRGLDYAPLKGPFDLGNYYARLDDETYRRAIRAKITANWGDGNIGTAFLALKEFLTPDMLLFVTDDGFSANANQFISLDDQDLGLDGPAIFYYSGATVATFPVLDMHMTVAVSGKWPPLIDAHVLSEQLIPIKPDGVRMDVYFPSIYGKPIFGLDMENEYVCGCDVGALNASADDLTYLPIDSSITYGLKDFSPDYDHAL